MGCHCLLCHNDYPWTIPVTTPGTVQGAALHRDRAGLDQGDTSLASGSQPREKSTGRACFLQGQFAGPILPSLTRRLCRAMRVHAQSLQPCPTLCDPIDCSPPGSSAHGILRARILEGVAMPFSRGSRVGSSQPRDQTCIFSPFLHWQMGSSPLAPPGKDLEPFCKRCQSRDQRRGNLLLLVPFIHSALME